MSTATATGPRGPGSASRARGRTLLALARALGAVVVVLLTVLAATGWLDLLRIGGLLAVGPSLREALPLQRLAGSGAQPLVRVVAAWLPAGIVAGTALRGLGFRDRSVRGAVMTAGCLLLLLLLGAAADAITESDPLRAHLAQQPERPVIWLAALLAGAGAALPGSAPARAR